MKTLISNEQSSSSSSTLRHKSLQFLIKRSTDLNLPPLIKYSALSLLFNRFYPSLSLSSQSKSKSKSPNWLLNPNREPNLQLFALISLWISTKFHGSPILSLQTLKSISDVHITDQHFTKRDFLDAEMVFLQFLGFEIGNSMICSPFVVLEEMVLKLKAVAKVGEMVSFEACLDVLDLVYESEEISRVLVEVPVVVVGGVLVCSFLMNVPKQKWEFPVLKWVNFVTGCNESDVVWVVKVILHHILGPLKSMNLLC